MMRNTLISLLILYFGQLAEAQSVVFERQVIGSSGNSYTQGNHHISATTGEVTVATGSGSAQILTQGFQQPIPKSLLTFTILAGNETCIGAANGAATVEDVSGCEPPYQVLWSNGNTGNTSYNWSTGWHTVTINSGNCQSEQSFFIGLDESTNCELVIYTGITPNADGDNDYWHIENIHLSRYQQNKVTIFNRWGDEVWAKENYDNLNVRWSGEGKKEKELPDGTYFYVLELADKTLKGYIELTR